MKKKRRILLGEAIISCNDNQLHYVSAQSLCELYGFKKDECYFIGSSHINSTLRRDDIRALLYSIPKYLPIYRPSYWGEYKYPKLKIWWQEFRYRNKNLFGTPKDTIFYRLEY